MSPRNCTREKLNVDIFHDRRHLLTERTTESTYMLIQRHFAPSPLPSSSLPKTGRKEHTGRQKQNASEEQTIVPFPQDRFLGMLGGWRGRECGSESVSHAVMSDSWRPHVLEPTRFLCERSSPGKNTEVGSHLLLQGIFLTQGSNLGPCIAGRCFTI